MADLSNSHLFMITTHGNAGNLEEASVSRSLQYITEKVTDNTSKIFIGFDGDGAYGEPWPTPSSTAVRIIDGLIKGGYKNVVLVQSQVYNYCGTPDDYSKKVPGIEIELKFHSYKSVSNTKKKDAEENVTSIPFYTIAYNRNEDEEQKDFINEYVEVEYGMRGKKGEKLLYKLPGGPISLSENKAELTLTDVAFLNVDLYGGTSHVKQGLKHDGKPAGSTAAWLASQLLTEIPNANIHLIALWDRNKEGDKKYELSITRRTLGLIREKGYSVKLLMTKKVSNSSKKTKKRVRRKKGARKSRKLRR
jgi:hypothetical protein